MLLALRGRKPAKTSKVSLIVVLHLIRYYSRIRGGCVTLRSASRHKVQGECKSACLAGGATSIQKLPEKAHIKEYSKFQGQLLHRSFWNQARDTSRCVAYLECHLPHAGRPSRCLPFYNCMVHITDGFCVEGSLHCYYSCLARSHSTEN